MNNLKAFLRGAVVPVLVLAVWELCSRAGFFSPVVLPAPSAVVAKWWSYLLPLQPQTPEQNTLAWMLSGELIHDAYSSLYRVVVGFLIGAGLALPMGLLMGANTRLYELFNPLMQILRPIPPIAYIPLAILWFGLGNPPSFFLIAIGAYFPVLMNTIAGVRQVDGIYIRAAKNLGIHQWGLFTRVILPAATPYILAGVRIGIGTAFIVVIVSEMIAVNDGLGFRILEAREFMWSDKIIAGMISIGLLGLALDTAVSRLNNYLLRWHRGLSIDMAQIAIQQMHKFFATDDKEVVALQNINLEIEAGEFVCLLGPSGCGKSTLLNALAGFSLPSSGRITVNGQDVVAPGPERGMVFQEYALFPWMSVAQNIAFGLEIQKKQKAQIQHTVDSLLTLLNLSDFRNRFPKDLSGGMRQRVAIARILALDSPIMLMDEPFGALDALTRRTLQDELLRIWQQLHKTIVFVTHSIEESIYLADRIVVMTYRPGTIKRDQRVNLPRPRDSSSAEFNALKRELSELVMEEQHRHAHDELRRAVADE